MNAVQPIWIDCPGVKRTVSLDMVASPVTRVGRTKAGVVENFIKNVLTQTIESYHCGNGHMISMITIAEMMVIHVQYAESGD